MLLHPLVLAAHQCRTRKHIHNISDVNAVQSLMSGVFCIREPYYHADLNAIALMFVPIGIENIRCYHHFEFLSVGYSDNIRWSHQDLEKESQQFCLQNL
jgi:hypothetical protein